MLLGDKLQSVVLHKQVFATGSSLCSSVDVSNVQVQHENMQQAEVLSAQSAQIEAVSKDLQDTQKLLAALQSMFITDCIVAAS